MLLILLIILMQFIDFTKQLKKDSIKQNLRNKIWVKFTQVRVKFSIYTNFM